MVLVGPRKEDFQGPACVFWHAGKQAVEILDIWKPWLPPVSSYLTLHTLLASLMGPFLPGLCMASVNCRTACYLLSSVSAGHNSLAKDTLLTFEKAIIKKLLINIKGAETIMQGSTCSLSIENPCYNQPGSCNSFPS